MANSTDTKPNVINKYDAGFPDYLDFKKLRQKGIEYLGKLSGHIWTDHNVHDPGITTLEVLIYAIMDLGYRTNLPLEDILALPPDKPVDFQKNFFTPSEILSCNPTTILDYRKLIMDIEGVRNAWLYDIADVTEGESVHRGIFQVYIDLEEETDIVSIKEAVREKLNSHRNLCEDFARDIRVLCKQKVGINTTIELDQNENVEEVYVKLVSALRNAITPSPTYYTLQQLLEKEKSIEDIFAGRPLNLEESYGFIDTEEVANIKLKKELHSSDLVNVVSQIPGVKRIDYLRFDSCDHSSQEIQGKFCLRKDHVPEFDVSCSDIQFTRNGISIEFDKARYLPLFEIKFNNTGKVLYHSPSPYLDLALPKGNLRTGLSDYYSIQNEFPDVYGISKGGLPENASDHRRAQALQLKAYLLFYDQLLANYLSQLVDARDLLSLSADYSSVHSYFAHRLKTVPDFKQLIKLNVEEQTSGQTANEDTILVFPVSRTELQLKEANNGMEQLDLNNVDPWYFESENACKICLEQTKLDIRTGNYEVKFISKNENCHFFYLITSSRDIALLSNNYYPDMTSARNDVDSLKFSGNLERNSKTYYLARLDQYSFLLKYHQEGYLETLQQIMENEAVFLVRRQEFLDHLLSRFAVQFTDFAQLSYNFFRENVLGEHEIKAKGFFLQNFPQLSSERGKAYDYLSDGWHNRNISGTEKRLKALTGILPLNRRHLNNFDLFHFPVYKYVEIIISDRKYFRSPDLFEKNTEAVKAVRQIMKAMQEKENYRSNPAEKKGMYELVLSYAKDKQAHFSQLFNSEEEADREASYLSYIFNKTPEKPESEDIIGVSYEYNSRLKDASGNLLKTCLDKYDSKEDLKKALDESIKALSDTKKWKNEVRRKIIPGRLKKVKTKGDEITFIDVEAFKPDINDTIVGKPGLFTFEALDKKNNFKLSSKKEFKTERHARSEYEHLLLRLAGEDAYRIDKIRNEEAFKIVLLDKRKIIAENSTTFLTREDALSELDKILDTVHAHVYRISISKEERTFKYVYHLAKGKVPELKFISDEEYGSRENAAKALTELRQSIGNVQLNEEKERLSLAEIRDKSTPGKMEHIFAAFKPAEGSRKSDTSISALLKAASPYLEEQQLIAPYVYGQAKVHEGSIHVDPASKRGTVVYQLIDKDNPQASVVRIEQPNERVLSSEEALYFLRRKAQRSYRYLQICLGGDIFRKREIKKDIFRYHFRIVCRNLSFRPSPDEGKGLILFESVISYQSLADAEQAFRVQYLEILQMAEDTNNYGRDKYISLTEILHSFDEEAITTRSVVFIPAETQEYLKRTHADPLKVIVAAEARSYPIVRIKNKKDVYRFLFRLNIHVHDLDKWVSIKSYDSVAEATKAFHFFLTLLEYPLNIVDEPDDHCISRIIIREIVLQSVRRFNEKEIVEAWGKEGVEKLIAVSQSPDTFHRFQAGSCYRFLVACNSFRLIHPHKYPTPEERDQQKEQLIQSVAKYKKIYEEMVVSLPLSKDVIKSKRQTAGPSFQLKINDQIAGPTLNLAQLFEDVRKIDLKTEAGELRYTMGGKDRIRFIPGVAYKGKIEEFKEHISQMALMFPVVREKSADPGKKPLYRVSIKIPGIKYPDATWQPDGPCGDSVPWETCAPVWESDCHFDTVKEAWEAYSQVVTILGDKNYYLDTYDCECASYGLELFPFSALPTEETDNPSSMIAREDILAISPNCYKNTEAACEAIERAKRLINSEGLHLVEHILLRDSDTVKRQKKVPQDLVECDFDWFVENDDPCEQKKPEAFEPGIDPYSFMATAILPAWTGRFQTNENKDLIEHILYRETPAHILLRILWLGPYDLYCFEQEYKNWLCFMSIENEDRNYIDRPDLRSFLINRYFMEYGEATGCLSCDENAMDSWKPSTRKRAMGPVTDQIHHLYEWQILRITDEVKNSFFNARLAGYKDDIRQILELYSNPPAMQRFEMYLSVNRPDSLSFLELMDELMELMDPSSTDNPGFSVKDWTGLTTILICFYLDKVVAEEHAKLNWNTLDETMKWMVLRKTFRRLIINGMDAKGILNLWKNGDVTRFYSAHDMNTLVARLL